MTLLYTVMSLVQQWTKLVPSCSSESWKESIPWMSLPFQMTMPEIRCRKPRKALLQLAKSARKASFSAFASWAVSSSARGRISLMIFHASPAGSMGGEFSNSVKCSYLIVSLLSDSISNGPVVV